MLAQFAVAGTVRNSLESRLPVSFILQRDARLRSVLWRRVAPQ